MAINERKRCRNVLCVVNNHLETPEASQALRKHYLVSRLREIVHCRTALTQNEWAPIFRAGENLSGNAESFDKLSPLGRRLETSALAKRKGETHQLLFQFERVVAEELSKL